MLNEFLNKHILWIIGAGVVCFLIIVLLIAFPESWMPERGTVHVRLSDGTTVEMIGTFSDPYGALGCRGLYRVTPKDAPAQYSVVDSVSCE